MCCGFMGGRKGVYIEAVMSIERYFLGCPIWGNKEWVGELFAPDVVQKDFLRQYASVFNTVEGNTTFYGLPSEKAALRWLIRRRVFALRSSFRVRLATISGCEMPSWRRPRL